jgi:hydrogenase expression/formation protein HypC
MCLAIPTQVLSLAVDGRGKVMLGGVELDVSLEMVDDVAVGDYVIVHVGHAIAKLDAEDAERTLALFAEIAALPGS